MRTSHFGPSVAVFLLFLGMALAEAFWLQDWLLSAVFVGLGIILAAAMNLPSHGRSTATVHAKHHYEPPIATPLF